MSQSFGSYVRSLRQSAHLSQRALAERLGVSFPYLCHVEHGERPPLVPARWPVLIEIGADYDILLSLATAWRVASLEAQIAQLRAGVLPDSANSDTPTHG